MRFSNIRILFRWKQVLSFAFTIVVFCTVIWMMSGFVRAYWVEKTVHIFPQTVTSVGWEGSDKVLKQDLSPKARFERFGNDNSSYIKLSAIDAPAPEAQIEATTTLPVDVAPVLPPLMLNPEPPVNPNHSVLDLPLPVIEEEISTGSASTTETAATSTDPLDDASTEESQVEPEATTTAPIIPLENFLESASTTEAASSTQSSTTPNSIEAGAPASRIADMFAEVGRYIYTGIFMPVSATSSEVATPAQPSHDQQPELPDDDIAVCAALNQPCYTVQVSGFEVAGTLRDKILKSASINFSFAAKFLDSAQDDNKLVVRYFRDGQWREAGEIFLNTEVSNGTNGGYFTAQMDDIDSWNQLADLKVVVEFARMDASVPAELFLDSVWIDTVYKDRAQQVLTGESLDESSDASENVAFSLRERDLNDHSLQMPDGASIGFGYTDDLSDTLFMRADKVSYAAGETAYFSITNTGTEADRFELQAGFPRGEGAVGVLEQYLKNIAATSERAVREDVTYYCEDGWKLVTGDRHRCAGQDEERVCASLNDTGKNCLVLDDTVGTEQLITYSDGWVPVEVVSDTPVENSRMPEGFRQSAHSAKQLEILPGQTLYFKTTMQSATRGPLRFALLASGNSIGDLDAVSLKSESVLIRQSNDDTKNQQKKRGLNRLSGKAEFNGEEKPEFRFEFKSRRNIVNRAFNAITGRGNKFTVEHVTVERTDGIETDIPVAVEYGKNGEWSMQIKQKPRSFKPGKYTAEIAMQEGNESFTETVEFYWGVLAINVDKSSYRPGENVSLQMAALSETGDTICDAILQLTIVSPSGSSTDVPTRQSELCGFNNIVESADYLADFSATDIGSYSIELSEFDEDGTVLHRVLDSFIVVESTPFTIKRTGATRIWPVADYVMTIELTAASDFTGEFIESVPTSFGLVDDGGAQIHMYGSAKNLVWPIDLSAGQSVQFSYTYDAPDISPYMYLLGPAEVRGSSGVPFSEGRDWKLASDATGNMLLYWDQIYIPTGWTCVSCLTTDAFYQRFIVGSSTPSVNGGAPTHTPTATGAVNAATTSQTVGNNNQATPVLAHTHTFTPVIANASNLPAYRELAVIQYNSTGEPPTIPNGAIAIFDVASSSLPSGWFRYSKQDARYVRSASTSTVGTTGGSNTHTHAITGTTGPAGTTFNAQNPGTGVLVGIASHTHTVSTTTASTSTEPKYIEALLARVTSTTTPPDTMIAMWTGDPSGGWDVVSSSSEPFENRFVKASTTYGGTGGTETHQHPNMIGTFASVPSGTVSRNNAAGTNASALNHSHSIDITSFSISSSSPPFRTAIFAKRVGGAPPGVPTLYDIPFDNEKSGTSTPYFEFSALDPDGTDSIIYQLQYDDDADLDTSPLSDRASDNETGCSPNCFENRISGGDTSPFNENERVRFTIQTPLVSGTTYYWRVRAKDSGASFWGAWATTTSYTYIANTSPSEWFQTEDAQFDTNVLSGMETYGANSARLTSNPPAEALIAYAEGTVQTPRYRLWDGVSIGAENSAVSVGGTINWIKTAAAPTRDEYIMGTLDASNDINFQVYNGVTDTWGNLTEVTAAAASAGDRGFDVAYETSSGDGMIVYCDGDADPSYRVWNGSTLLASGSINLASANNCEWISLASDPTSDEIIVVSRDTAAGTNDYEAQVWDGSAWGNSKLLGGMTDVNHEGMAVEYEESGNQAIVITSNGDTANFIWASWDGSAWGVNVTQTIGNDFEWGTLRRDVGTDNLSVCYIDASNDIGTLLWDGNAWDTFTAGADERETGGNTLDGRAVDCAFETTTGRDGYIMLPYSDTTNGRYQFWNTASWSAEASVSTIQDSWTVNAIRTGDGTIVSVFHDDANTQYDFTYWNGSSWAATTNIEGTLSVTVTPFMEPFDLAAQIYQSNSGTMTSTVIDFDVVSSRQTWGDVIWNATEPAGTTMKLQLFFDSGSGCTTPIPNAALAGNGAGFSVAASPLNISGLSTSTYNRICLQATSSTATANVPTLDDWTVTWERQPYLTQTHYQWYANEASLTPTDRWPAGGDLVAEDTPIPTEYAPSPGDVLRLRLGLLTENVLLSANDLLLRLQYAEDSSCSESSNWQDVGAIGSTTAAWRGYDNGGLSDGATIPGVLLSTTDTPESYEEENDSALNPNFVALNNEGEWDWVIQHNTSNAVEYCFRVIKTSGETLNEYDVYPSLVTNSAPAAPSLEAPFDYEAVASTTPWFQFVSEDPEADEISYEIQVDDDSAFGSPLIDEDSETNVDDFTNVITPSDKDTFTSAQSIRYVPTTVLSNGTTYYWRVRARDRNKSTEYGAWSETYSVTIDTSVTISTWRQTTFFQFSANDHENTEATTTPSNEVLLSPGQTTGTSTGPAILYSQRSSGNSWGQLSWNDTETSSDIKYHIEYYDGSQWDWIPDSDLPGNAAGYDTSPLVLLGVSPSVYDQIRIQAVLNDTGATPHLLDWTLTWGLSVEQPTLITLFDNEKTATTTPTFTFVSDDLQNDSLEYEISIASLPTFISSTTRRSAIHSGFSNTASSTDTSSFVSGDTISFKVQQADALTNGNTYWWRVRARDPDPGGGNSWSVWSDPKSFTIDTAVTVSTWFQTTSEQFDTNALDDTETNSNSARITSLIREAFTAYSEGTVQSPRFRIWNGVTWSAELSGVSVGDTMRFVEAAAAPTRDEYIIGTQGATGGVDFQVVEGTTDVAGNKVRSITVSDLTQRGFDIAYETTSGDALAVTCFGTEASYRVWDGASWSSTSTITLAVTANCEWVKLASDPTSDEIIAVFRDATTGATDYQALVWSGSAWGNSMTMGSQSAVNNEGIAVEYEESGGQAMVAVANGLNNNFIWNTWNGTTWSGAVTTGSGVGNDFQSGRIARDLGSDNLVMCYVDFDLDLGILRWNGSAWSAFQEFETAGNAATGRPISCEFETTTSRDGYIMVPYSDTLQGEYVAWDGALLSASAVMSTVQDSAEIRSARTGDGNILVVAYDDPGTNYDFTYWNGSVWSTIQQLEANSIAAVAPTTVPIDIVARRYPTFTFGTVTTDEIDFDAGSGPRWGSITFNKTTPGSSSIRLHLEYLTSTSSWALIPDTAFPGNALGTTTSPVDISGLNRITYNTIRMKADLNCVAGNCPTLNDWTLSWAAGLTISGIARQFDETTNVTSGTVAVAVNGVIQSGKTGTISGGTWSISNVTAFDNDIVTVFVSGAANANKAVAVTKYTTTGNISGMQLYERHLSLGSDDNPTITNADLALYDNSTAGANSSYVFHDVDSGNDLAVCASNSLGCFPNKLFIKQATTYRPDSTSSGNVTARDFRNDGIFIADGNTIRVGGSWDNNAVFTSGNSTVIFTATSTNETIDFTGASSTSFTNLTIGESSGTATTSMQSPVDVTGTLSIQYGTLSQNVSRSLTLSGDLTIGSSGRFNKGGLASTTFNGSGSRTWTDSTASKQDLGDVFIDGTTKTVTLGSNVKATNITIGADDTLSASASNYSIDVFGNWTNNNVFTAQSGTVNFVATTTGKVINPGSSNFYNLSFSGVGGNWSFSTSTITVGNNFTVATGTVTMPTATTTIAGSFDASTGTFSHNNGTIIFNAATAKTIHPGTQSFYDLVFNGTGSWSFTSANATSSRTTILTAGTLTAPSGTFAIGGSHLKNGGTFTHNSGTLKFTSATAHSVRLGNSDAYNLTFAGSATNTFLDTNATTTNSVRFQSGTAVLPSGTLAVGGSWINPGGTFTHSSGAVRFNSADTGETIQPGSSTFYNVWFDSASGGWTVSQNATSSNHLSVVNASTLTVSSGVTLAVGGTFSNAVGGGATTFTNSSLSLYSGTSYSINSKSTGSDTYGNFVVSSTTHVRMWNSSAATTSVASTSSLYSQDHAAVDGDLYIWGRYTAPGSEYWSYANDFDGTVLSGGSRRAVQVRLASSTIFVAPSTFSIVGDPTATTTIAVQGSGAYSLMHSGGTLNAQYYQVRNTDRSGFVLTGSTTITSIANGDFETGVASGTTMMTIGPGVINANPAYEIQAVRFATSSGVVQAYNVTATGTPSSYWWFRNHYGNFAGEARDNDPGGNPGNIRWDDSDYSITVSGRVYTDEGSTLMTSPTCDGSTQNVRIVVNGGAAFSGSCASGTGLFSIPNVAFSGDAVITAYLNTGGGRRAVTVTKTPTVDITNLNLYENMLIVRHEGGTPITIANLAVYDFTDDTDVFFTAATSSTDTLVTQADTGIFVWGGKTFTPAGNITLQSGTTTARDGLLHVAAGATFTAVGTQSHSLGGGIRLDTGATFTAASSTFTFTATTTRAIYSAAPMTFYNATFNGSGGIWNLSASTTGATTTVQNSLTVTAGTLSGTSDLIVSTGGIAGAGSVSMTAGIVRLDGTGSFGNANPWQFYNLILGNGTSGTLTKNGAGTTTINRVLTLAASETLQAGSSPWVFTAGGTPFLASGTFTVQTAPFWFTATTSTTIDNDTYAALYLAPAGVGTPTFTPNLGSTLNATNVFIGGANPVIVDANSNDPTIVASGDFTILSGSTFTASNIGQIRVAGNWTNTGTFTSTTGSEVLFNAIATGKTITPGSSSFYDLTFDGVSGGWTIAANATSTRNFSLTNATSFTVSPNTTFAVGGAFTNSVGGSATTWATSTLYLNSGSAYSINTKTLGGDTYGTLQIGANTDVRMWNSSAATTTVNATGSLYSQDHAAVDGALNIWGEYVRASGSDYWSYATDFDGTSLTGIERKVNVNVASSSSLSFSGGVLDIVGSASASTTIAVQGTGRYSFGVSGGTLTANYYELRNLDSAGLSISGSPTVSSLSYGDIVVSMQGGTAITVAATAIDANPLKIFVNNRFATSSVTSATNVTATGVAISSWKFNLHYGGLSGEAYDSDPGGDPGYIRWDDSASQITISGNVYSDEGSTVSTVCDSSTQVVRLKVQGAGTFTSSCNISTGLYSFSGVQYNPGDVLTVFLDTGGGRRAANISVDPITSIANMHLYENRVIVRHEDTSPINIADMTIYDSDNDTDIPFNATDAATDTLVVPFNIKLIVWIGKTFAPAGEITLQSGNANAWAGTLEVQAGGTFSAAGSQSHSIGGSMVFGTDAILQSGNSTFTFTATTTGKTVSPYSSSFYNITFNGTGGNWSFATSSVTATNDFVLTNGTLTLATATTTVGGSFTNTGGTLMHNNGTLAMTSTAGGKSVRLNGSDLYSLTFNGTGGAWSFFDTNATTSRNLLISAGGVTLPSGTLAVGSSFDNTGGTFTHNSGTVKLTAVTSGKSLRAGGSNFNHVLFNGVGGEWTMPDTNVTVNDFRITNGSTTLPTGTLTVAGSFVNAGTFANSGGTVLLNATATGKSVTASSSPFYNLTFNSASGGWTITGNATSTNNATLSSATSFTLTQGQVLAVGGTFTNGVGGSATTWATSTLSLYSNTSYSINTKSAGGDIYGTLRVSSTTQIKMWNSAAATTTVDSTAYLYSQDHSNMGGTPQDGSLYIWGSYSRSSGTDYWSHATDFDGTALGGGSRAVSVRLASSTSVAFTGASLNIVGAASASTTIQNQGAGRYAMSLAGGTLSANYFQFRNLDQNGFVLTGAPTVSVFSNGDFETDVISGASMLKVTDTVIDANASFQLTGMRFATSSGVLTAINVTFTGTSNNAWTFSSHYGNRAGEAYDSDGGDACGNIRWSDSSCLFVSQEHYRWRNDDGGEGALASDWYNASWSKRKRLGVTNSNATAYTNLPVKVVVDYDADMKSDFSDLRFTDSTGTTTVPYWIESYVSSASSTVWVNVSTLGANSSNIVYMYYGNAGASSIASGTTTFTFFDDFEDGDIVEYSGSVTDKGYFAADGSFNHNWTNGLHASTGNTAQKTTSGGIYQTTSSYTGTNKTIRFYQYVDTTAGSDDEPCTLFGVQASAQNYAVCLDEFPSDRVILARNVTSNDGSGTLMASTNVTWATGWYEVVIDWISNTPTNSIQATVYNSSGAVFASVSTSTNTYTSGGVGFSFWGQNGGWDFYSVKQYTAVAPTVVTGAEQASNGATWKAAEDTEITDQDPNENLRIRFSIHNTGSPLSNQLYGLQYASKGSSLNCESVPYVNFAPVPSAASCGSAAACMTTSAQFTNQSATAGLLTYPANMSFAPGQIIEDPSNETTGYSVGSNSATEVEYSFELTDNATQNAYCFRVADDDIALDNYTRVAEVVVAHPPQISNFTLNYLSDIALTEGATTTIYATATTTDQNGYTDIVSATSTIYRSGVGPSCSANDNNCYQIASTSCSFSSCAGNSCTLSCRADIQYFAEPTDFGTYASNTWLSRVQVEDSTGKTDVDTSPTVELGTLYGLSINTGAINFGDIVVGQNTNTTNATTTLQNTGNADIDIGVSGTNLTGGAGTINVGEQKYSTTTFAYGSCSICGFLSGAATDVNVVLPKPTATTTAATSSIYWGINIPGGTPATSGYLGTNTFIAVTP